MMGKYATKLSFSCMTIKPTLVKREMHYEKKVNICKDDRHFKAVTLSHFLTVTSVTKMDATNILFPPL